MAVKELASLYVGGRWARPASGDELAVVNPATEETIATLSRAGTPEVESAVAEARRAAAGWSQQSPAARAEVLRRIGERLDHRREEIARAITSDVGTPIKESRERQVGLAVRAFFTAADVLEEVLQDEQLGDSVVIKQPLGVSVCITPWNYPMYQMATKIAPALGAGCTVVAKPSEVAPLGPLELAEAISDSGLPPGVFNLVLGSGRTVGEALVQHPEVDAVSFTGSTAAGRRVAALAAATVKHLSLELGGKSASVVLADGDIERAVEGTVAKCFQNAGQTCAALTRLLVPHSMLGQVEELAVEAARRYIPDDPQLETTRLGPLVSDAQRSQVLDHIHSGVREGARLLAGGDATPSDMSRGFYVAATVFSSVSPEMGIAREEIFGPVLVVIPYSDESEAIEIANATDYGLSGAVWSADLEKAYSVAGRLRCGSVSINGAATNPDAPFGGFKQSGYGRERGRFGIEEFLTTTALNGLQRVPLHRVGR